MSTTTNGQMRKTLASQLDRLDAILDTLSEGLNEAVAGAVQEAVGVAVREAITGLVTEVLTHPDLLTQLRALLSPAGAQSTQPAGEKEITAKNRLQKTLSRVWGGIKARVRSVYRRTRTGMRRIAQWAGSLLSRCRLLGQYRRQIFISVGVGTALGLGAYYAGPYLAAAAGWLGGFATSLGVQAGIAWRRLRMFPTS